MPYRYSLEFRRKVLDLLAALPGHRPDRDHHQPLSITKADPLLASNQYARPGLPALAP